MHTKAEIKNKNLLPRTLEQFMANKKKQQIINSNSAGKRTNRKDKDDIPIEQIKPDQRKISLVDDDDNWDPNQVLPEIKEKLVYSEYQQIKEEMLDEHFQKLKNKVKDALIKIPAENEAPIKVAELMRQLQIQLLSSADLKVLQQQFSKNKSLRNCSVIDPILQRNKLIGIFTRDKRQILYLGSQLLIFSKGEEVYKEGSRSGSMYIVVKGYVKILQTKQTSYGEKIVLEFTTLHEGSHFGSNALGDQELKHNTNTAITSSKTYLLRIDSQLYKQLMINSEENDFEKKIQVINLISFLRTQTKMSLTPLVSSMKQLIFKFGQVIIKKGKLLDKIWIVGEGTLQVFVEERARKKITSTDDRKKQRSFVFGNCKVKPLNKRRFADTLYFPQQPTQKSLLYGNKVLLNDDQLEYTDQIVFGQIQRGQCFGGRALYPQFYKVEKQNKFPDFKFDTHAKLDVACNCIKAVVYELDQKKFAGLPDSLQKTIIQGLCSLKDFDYQDIQTKIEQKKEWKKYSDKIVQTIRKDNKGRAKSLFQSF